MSFWGMMNWCVWGVNLLIVTLLIKDIVKVEIKGLKERVLDEKGLERVM